MRLTTSEYPNLRMVNPPEDIYKLDFNEHVEQSAIYSNVHFPSIDEEGLGIVLTSQCDFSGKQVTDFVLMARIADLEMYLTYWLLCNNYPEKVIIGEEPIPEKMKSREKTIQKFEKYVNNTTYQYYFLPGLSDKFSHSLITFEVTQCITFDEIEPKNKICVLKSPFRECVPSKYSAYVGRIGTPDYPKKYQTDILNSMCKLRDT